MQRTYVFTIVCLAIALACAAASPAHAETCCSAARADSHAPIGVMGDHTHDAGGFMFSYRYMLMQMDGNMDGTSDLSTEQVLDDFMVAPLNMTMQMHMFGMMYAPNDIVTLAFMLPYEVRSMEHITRMNQRFTTETEGIGDVSAMALVRLTNWQSNQLHINAGVSAPSSDITYTGDTPNGNQRLPYPMQIGTGTWSVVPGLTYNGWTESWSWGAQGSAVLRVDSNSEGYTFGDVGRVTAWGARRFANWISASARINGVAWGNVDGADQNLNPMMVPTADPNLRGGERVDAALGLNLLGTGGWVEKHRLAAELLMPVYQSMNGPQLATDWTFVVGWQYSP